MKNKITSIIFIIGFIALSITNALTPTIDFSENENRFLQGLPKFSVERLFEGKFTSEFETYTTDQFIARDSWISLKTISEKSLFKQDNSRVYFGKDGFLFEIHDKLDEEQLSKNIDAVKTFFDDIGNTHPEIKKSILIAPTSSTINSDKLPPFAPTIDQIKIINKVNQSMPDDVISLDVVTDLLPNAETNYYKTDHHWSTMGAYVAYTSWAKALGIIPLSLTDFNIDAVSDMFFGTTYSKANLFNMSPDTIYGFFPKKENPCSIVIDKGTKTMDSLYDKSFLDKKDKYAYFLGGNNPLLDITTSVKNGNTIMVIKDSYAHCFIPFLTNHYERIIVLDMRYIKYPPSTMLDEYAIDDILILYNTNNFVTDRNITTIK